MKIKDQEFFGVTRGNGTLYKDFVYNQARSTDIAYKRKYTDKGTTYMYYKPKNINSAIAYCAPLSKIDINSLNAQLLDFAFVYGKGQKIARVPQLKNNIIVTQGFRIVNNYLSQWTQATEAPYTPQW